MNQDEIKFMNDKLKVLKGKKLQLCYDGKVILEKVDPTAEELIEALYSSGVKE